MRIRESIQMFLRASRTESPFLIDRWTPSLETQVMTSQEGEPTDAPGEFTAEGETWSNKRWPYNAGTSPNYSDPPITFSPAARVDLVGTTWWDWESKKSIAVGIDIDHQDGHAASTNSVDDTQLDNVLERLQQLDYVTAVRSKGGKGLHVYVFFDPESRPDAANHHEHAIVARKTLKLISDDLGYDLGPHVDCVGSIFWIWARHRSEAGFTLVKEGGYLDGNRLAAISLPTPTYRGRQDAGCDSIPVTEEHRRVLSAIAEQPFYFNFRQDLGMAHAHTCAVEAAVKNLNLPGGFVTASDGNDPASANCYLIPHYGGGFRVCRFGQSQHEPNWEWDGQRNFCYIGVATPVAKKIEQYGDRKAKGKYQISSQTAREVAEELGESLPSFIPESVTAKVGRGKLTLETKQHVEGWDQLDGMWRKVISMEGEDQLPWITQVADPHVRFVAQDGSPVGWYVKCRDGWVGMRSYNEVGPTMIRLFGDAEMSAKDQLIRNHWVMVSEPFKPEHPGGRKWNLRAPQLACEPATSGGDHPHFDMILEHIGEELDLVVQGSDWCRRAGLHSGADYLRAWLACLIHHPDQPLPYLFLVGPQNSGKSIFHEAAKMLFTSGVISANSAISNDHNAELQGALLVYIEERDLADKRIKAYERIKELTTCREMLIHEKFKTPILLPSYLHFVQMANSPQHLPLEDGDTRVVVIDVPAIRKEVPKPILESRLRDEVPRFLRTLLNMSFPPPVSRLRIPALTTGTKEAMEEQSRSTTMQFVRDSVHPAAGHKISFEDFYSAYTRWCSEKCQTPEPTTLVAQELMLRSDRVEVGSRGKRVYIVNASFDSDAEEKSPIIVRPGGVF